MNHVLNFNKWTKLNEEEAMDAMMSTDMTDAASDYPKPGAIVHINTGKEPKSVPTDSATVGMASKIIGTIMTATSGIDDNEKVQNAIYSIKTPQLYYACLWMVAKSTKVKAHYGFNFSTICNMLSQDMTYASGTAAGIDDHIRTSTEFIGAKVARKAGYTGMYADIERHLQQFNDVENIKKESLGDR